MCYLVKLKCLPSKYSKSIHEKKNCKLQLGTAASQARLNHHRKHHLGCMKFRCYGESNEVSTVKVDLSLTGKTRLGIAGVETRGHLLLIQSMVFAKAAETYMQFYNDFFLLRKFLHGFTF